MESERLQRILNPKHEELKRYATVEISAGGQSWRYLDAKGNVLGGGGTCQQVPAEIFETGGGAGGSGKVEIVR